MKQLRSYFLLMILGSLASCQPSCVNNDEIICETVHRYGVPLEPQDWSERGQNGQVVSVRKDGVTVTRTYETGILHGECIYSFPHRDIMQKKEIYDRGFLVQECLYYSNGLPEQQITHESQADQSMSIWYENGVPQCHEKSENGRLVQGEYYNSDHHLESKVENANGMRTCRDGLGQLKSVDTIQDGQMILRTTYYPQGTPASQTPYVNGFIEGQRRTYLVGGEPATIEDWTGNIQHGNTIVFEHGEKWADVPYVKGCKQGLERRYRNGCQEVAQEIRWAKGRKHGPCQTYVGNTCQQEWYFRGRRVPNEATFNMLRNQ